MPTITYSGLASGLDTSSWVDAFVSVKQTTVTSLQSKQSTLSTLQTSFNTLRTKIEKLTDAKFGGSLDIFSSNTATSSDTSLFTATATKSATRQSYSVTVDQLATDSVAKSDHATSALADDTTKLSSLGVTTGTVSVYVNGVKNTVNIESSDTVADLKTKFSPAGVNATIDSNGKLNLATSDSSSTVLIGSTNDTSNMKSLFGLTKQDDGSYQSSTALYKSVSSSALTTENLFTTGTKDSSGNPVNTTVKAGTFTIGGAEFTIDSSTTMSSLVSKINASSTAGVSAYWDSTNAKLILTSKNEGASYINVEAGTSNFTDVMGLTTSSWNEDGTVSKTALNTDNQTWGKNAIATINGTKVVASSNTISSDVSKMAGVTITLKKTSDSTASAATLNVTQDTSSIVTVVKDFVTQYNSVLSTLSTDTASTGQLYGETPLIAIKTSIRQATTSADSNNSTYNLLAQIGISTASTGADLSADTDSLSVDTDKLEAALTSNPDAVKALLVGTGSNTDGILDKMGTTISNAMSSSGYFSTKAATLKSDYTSLNDKITTEQSRVTKYKSTLQTKFQAMETAISKMQQAYSSYLNSSSSSSSSSSSKTSSS